MQTTALLMINKYKMGFQFYILTFGLKTIQIEPWIYRMNNNNIIKLVRGEIKKRATTILDRSSFYNVYRKF